MFTIPSLKLFGNPKLCAVRAIIRVRLGFIRNNRLAVHQTYRWLFSANANGKVLGTDTPFRKVGKRSLDYSVLERVKRYHGKSAAGF